MEAATKYLLSQKTSQLINTSIPRVNIIFSWDKLCWLIYFTSFKSGSSDGGNSICEMFLSNINLGHDRLNQSEGD